MRAIALCSLSLMVSASVHAQQRKVVESERFWMQRAIQAIGQIENELERNDALFHLNPGRCQAGDLAGASADARTMGASPVVVPKLVVQARIEIATHHYATGAMKECLAELKQAESVAVQGFNVRLVNAYLDLLGSSSRAIGYARAVSGQDRSVSTRLVQAFAERGYVADALEHIATIEHAINQAPLLRSVGYICAERANVAEVNRVVDAIRTQRDRQSVLARLVKSLVRKKRITEARRVVEKVSDARFRARLDSMLEPKEPASRAKTAAAFLGNARNAEPASRRDHLYGEAIRQYVAIGDAKSAEQTIRVWAADAKSNPIEPTTGQFGPYNNKMRLAMIQSQHARVALVHIKDGDKDAARAHLQLAEQAVSDLALSGSFIGLLGSAGEMLGGYLALSDAEELKKVLERVPVSQWAFAAPRIVETFLADGDTETAIEIADRAVAGQFGGSHVSAALIRGGEFEAGLRILQKPQAAPSDSCRTIGGLMVQQGQGKLLRDALADFAPIPRAHLCIGAQAALTWTRSEPDSEREEALSAWLTAVVEKIPGARLRETYDANPGHYAEPVLVGVAKTFAGLPQGVVVRLESAAIIRFHHPDWGHGAVTCFELEDQTTAKHLMTISRSADSQGVRKGRYVMQVRMAMAEQAVQADVRAVVASEPLVGAGK